MLCNHTSWPAFCCMFALVKAAVLRALQLDANTMQEYMHSCLT